MQILVINPNSSENITTLLEKTLTKCCPPDVSLEFCTCPKPGAAVIDSITEATLTAALIYQNILTPKLSGSYDAIVVACYSPTPLVEMIRESFDVPCLGIVQASIQSAMSVGRRIGILTTTKRSELMLYELLKHLGISRTIIAGIQSSGLTVEQLATLPEEERISLLVSKARKLVLDLNADVVCLGGAVLASLRDLIQEAIGPNIVIVDGVRSAVEQLATLVRQGIRTSKGGIYTKI
ncbi:hydantoin racemase family protein [Schizosaccharomyces japonicus yFS275]|uniref:Hydantoin racemase family protein n=1 Tax=Schizosaccharomyces japonicus (strain yFS275 / FY16936) TaxID=402676 RepID=B6K6G7_SCHJY|nr:hydantoin racemase family protein [Schizosaccharomyces japonicus yFS275]EEB09121.1 hydantoin racemase family protein [Schizosaccharomyces japonicus yFS275]